MSVKRGAKLLIIDAAKCVLVLRRSNTHPHIPLTSDLPGGVIEHGETPEGAACRETMEETGITVDASDITLVGTRAFEAFGLHYELYLYVTHVKERPSITLSWEHDKFDWIPILDVNDLDDGFQPMLDEFRQSEKA